MVGFNELDLEWFEACINDPISYKIVITNGPQKYTKAVRVIDDYTGEYVYTFTLEAEYFLRQVLNYCGCVVDN